MRQNRRSLVLASVLTLVASTSLAGFAGTEVFLPSVGKGPGTGVDWSTTIWIHNPAQESVVVQVFFLPRGQANLTPVVFHDSIASGETRRYDDAMELMFGSEGFGAMRILAPTSIVVSSRIFSNQSGAPASQSSGQFFGATPRSFAISEGQATSLLGVYQTDPAEDSDFRYNFGFVEASGANATVRAIAVAADGTELGSKIYPVRPYEPIQKGVAALLPDVDARNLRIVLEVASGPGSIIGFGSAITNGSDDPSTFEMSYRADLLAEGGSTISSVTAGDGLAGGGDSGDIVLEIATEGITGSMIGDGEVTPNKLAPGAILGATTVEAAVASETGTDRASAICECPPGFGIISGGCEATGGSDTLPRIVANRAELNGWLCSVGSAAGTEVTAICFAYCLQ